MGFMKTEKCQPCLLCSQSPDNVDNKLCKELQINLTLSIELSIYK